MSKRDVTESVVAAGVCKLAAQQADRIARFKQIKSELPDIIELSERDRRPSVTRRGEEMWEQKFRNIKSHYMNNGNYIAEGLLEHVPKIGYRITSLGLSKINYR